MPLISSFPASVSTGGGGASLRTAYSQTAPATDGSVALWVKGDAPTGGEYLSALVEYGEISVENTQHTNASSSYVLGGGVYNGAIYFAQRTGSSYIDIMKLDLSTFQVSTFKDKAENAASPLGRGFVRGNKFYLISCSGGKLITIDLDTGSSSSASFFDMTGSFYNWTYDVNQDATKIRALRRRVSGSGDQLNTGLYECFIATPDNDVLVFAGDSTSRSNHAHLLDCGDVLYAIAVDFVNRGFLNVWDVQLEKTVSRTDIEYCWITFRAGDSVYLVAGETNCSIYKIGYDGTSISSEVVAQNIIPANYFTVGIDSPVYPYTSGYAVDGNVLWLYAFPTDISSTTAPIIRVTLNADQYETDSIIISTTMQQKNLATIVKDDGVEIKVFVNEVLRKNADGTTSSVEAYTLSSDGTWVRV